MTFMVIGMAFLSFLVYERVSVSLEFSLPKPVISTDFTYSSLSIKKKNITQVINSFFQSRSPLEQQLFARENFELFNRDKLILNQKKIHNKLSKSFSISVIETHLDYGTSFVSKSTEVKLTNHKYTFITKESYFDKSNSIIPVFKYTEYSVLLNSDNKILKIETIGSSLLTAKNSYRDFLNKITAQNITNYLHYNSPMSALTMSFMNITSLRYDQLKLTTSLAGEPIGDFIIYLNNEPHKATIELTKEKFPVILIN